MDPKLTAVTVRRISENDSSQNGIGKFKLAFQLSDAPDDKWKEFYDDDLSEMNPNFANKPPEFQGSLLFLEINPVNFGQPERDALDAHVRKANERYLEALRREKPGVEGLRRLIGSRNLELFADRGG